jgi:hypothetical protein
MNIPGIGVICATGMKALAPLPEASERGAILRLGWDWRQSRTHREAIQNWSGHGPGGHAPSARRRRDNASSVGMRPPHVRDLAGALRRRGSSCKAVVWAHNSHIGNAAATAMGWQGEFNIGELCRTAYGDEAVLIGFGTDRGTVAASSDWGGPMEVKTVRPARRDSYEYAFRMTGLNRALADWRRKPHGEPAIALREPLLERAIGVVYRPARGRIALAPPSMTDTPCPARRWPEERPKPVGLAFEPGRPGWPPRSLFHFPLGEPKRETTVDQTLIRGLFIAFHLFVSGRPSIAHSVIFSPR